MQRTNIEYATSMDDVEEDPRVARMQKNQKLASITGSKQFIEEEKKSGPTEDPMAVNFDSSFCQDFGHRKIGDNMDSYQKRAYARMLSPERVDPLAQQKQGKKGAIKEERTYKDIMNEQLLINERQEALRLIKQREDENRRKNYQQ